MSLALFNAVPARAIEILYDEQNQPWFKRAHVGKFLDLSDIHKSLDKLNECEMCTRNDFEPTRSNTLGWSGPKDQQNKTDIFLSVYGVMHVIVGSRKSKGKELKEWVMSDIIPRGFNAIITEKQQTIEDNNRQHQLTITQFQENLHQSNNQLQAITYQNQDLVHEIQELRQRYVAPLMNSRKNNIIIIIRKHTISDNDKYHHYPYYIARIQKRKRYIKLRWFQRHFPQHKIIVELDCANSIVSFNRFEEDGFVERKYNHFRLLQDLTRDDLYDMGIPAIDYEDED